MLIDMSCGWNLICEHIGPRKSFDPTSSIFTEDDTGSALNRIEQISPAKIILVRSHRSANIKLKVLREIRPHRRQYLDPARLRARRYVALEYCGGDDSFEHPCLSLT